MVGRSPDVGYVCSIITPGVADPKVKAYAGRGGSRVGKSALWCPQEFTGFGLVAPQREVESLSWSFGETCVTSYTTATNECVESAT